MTLPDGIDIEVIFGYLIFFVVLIVIIYYLIADSIYIYKQKNKVVPEVAEGKRIRNLIERDIIKNETKFTKNETKYTKNETKFTKNETKYTKNETKYTKNNFDNNNKRKPILI